VKNVILNNKKLNFNFETVAKSIYNDNDYLDIHYYNKPKLLYLVVATNSLYWLKLARNTTQGHVTW